MCATQSLSCDLQREITGHRVREKWRQNLNCEPWAAGKISHFPLLSLFPWHRLLWMLLSRSVAGHRACPDGKHLPGRSAHCGCLLGERLDPVQHTRDGAGRRNGGDGEEGAAVRLWSTCTRTSSSGRKIEHDLTAKACSITHREFKCYCELVLVFAFPALQVSQCF